MNATVCAGCTAARRQVIEPLEVAESNMWQDMALPSGLMAHWYSHAVGTRRRWSTGAGYGGYGGDLVDLVALRSDLSGNPTYRELVRRLATTTLDAFANAAPACLVLGGESPSDHPFAQVMMKLSHLPEGGRGAMFISEDRFAPEMRESFVSDYPTLVESLVQNPDQRIGA